MSLLHLDLTMNALDIADVMALSSGLYASHVIRCLDVNISSGDEEFPHSTVGIVPFVFFLAKKRMTWENTHRKFDYCEAHVGSRTAFENF
jgi:hypothetical protein